MPDIVLTTLNARYAHASFGLRYLFANLGELQPRAAILEFDIAGKPLDVVETILAAEPTIVGVGVYIWNVEPATRLVAALKRVRPDIIVVIGGPEVSYEIDQQEIAALADYVVTGEADLAFAALCRTLLAGERRAGKIVSPELPSFELKRRVRLPIAGALLGAESATAIRLPYDHYTAEDIAHRVIYVEASRGCPFKCEFCLSSLDVPVRNVPLDAFLPAMQRLLDRGVRSFKFVDRTFNLNLNISQAILNFFLKRYMPGLFLHFEMIPDRLPEALRKPIQQFPPGALQFEVGIQSFNEDVCARISRRQDVTKIDENVRFLRSETGVHVHADLIVGLPGEDLDSFARGFDRLVGLSPQEIQVGLLKRLRGTPIVRHDVAWGMVYSAHPPYEILKTGSIDFATMQRLRRFARFWDLIANSGNFVRTKPLIWRDNSPFRSFLRLSDWLFERVGRNHAIALPHLADLIFKFLTDDCGKDAAEVAPALWEDYRGGGRRDGPEFLRPHLPDALLKGARRTLPPSGAPRRQARHIDSAEPLATTSVSDPEKAGEPVR